MKLPKGAQPVKINKLTFPQIAELIIKNMENNAYGKKLVLNPRLKF